MFNIVITGMKLPHVHEEIESLSDIAQVTYRNCGEKAELLELVKNADVIMTDSEIIDAEVFDSAKKLRLVVEYGVGVDNIDITAATRRGVLVCNVPDAFIDEVAEHAIALMLCVARNIDGMNRSVQEDRTWDFNRLPVLRMRGKTLGVIGFGNIGRAVGKIAEGMGMHILAFDAFMDAERISSFGAEPCGLNDIISRADVITLHVPHTNETHHMIDADAIARMKPGAILLNVARGGVVDEAALAQAIRVGQIFGAGIDVMENEPEVFGSPLMNCPNVVLTPHMGWKSEVAAHALETAAVREVRGVLMGEKPLHLVNRELASK